MAIKIHTLKCEMSFGKYRGQVLEDIIKKDPNYVIWAIENTSFFDIDEKAEAVLQDFVEGNNPDD